MSDKTGIVSLARCLSDSGCELISTGNTGQILREAGLFEEVRLQGIVEREMEEGETVVERFSLRARLPAGGEGNR